MFDFDPTDWPQTPQAAIDMQKAWRARVRLTNEIGKVRVIAGVDVAYDPATDRAFAVALLLDAEGLKSMAHRTAWLPAAFPYVPGLLSFREVPAVMAALAQLPQRPDLLMVDGQGMAHPRRFGIAAHLGVLTDLPAIGVAKSRLCGHHATLPPEKGATAPLIDHGEMIGTALRSKTGCNPLYISAGHRIDQATALAWTLRCLKSYRLPEPTRLADKLSKQKDDRLFA